MIGIFEPELKLIHKLHPIMQDMVIHTLFQARIEGLYLGIFTTLRTFDEQNVLYSKGRDDQGKIIDKFAVVTNAAGGMSWHNYGLACDIVFKTDKGGWTWDSNNWNNLGAIGQYHGLEWGGSWKNIIDSPHFQYTKGLASIHVAKELYDKGGIDMVWKSII